MTRRTEQSGRHELHWRPPLTESEPDPRRAARVKVRGADEGDGALKAGPTDHTGAAAQHVSDGETTSGAELTRSRPPHASAHEG